MLGEGAFAKVYAIDDARVRKVFQGRRRTRGLVEKEATAMRAVALGDRGRARRYFVALLEADGRSITMERAGGVDLFDYIAMTSYPRRITHMAGLRHVIAAIGYQIFDALDHLHQHLPRCTVIHYDIKPENIRVVTDPPWNRRRSPTLWDLVTKRFTIKLLDFGAASVLYEDSRLDQRQRQGNTVEYQSPECLLHLAVTPAADIWSAACTVFTTLAGMLLFDVRPETAASDEGNPMQDARHMSLLERMLGECPLDRRRRRDLFQRDGQLHPYLEPEHLPRRRTLRQRLAAHGDAGFCAEFCAILCPCLHYAADQRPSAASVRDKLR